MQNFTKDQLFECLCRLILVDDRTDIDESLLDVVIAEPSQIRRMREMIRDVRGLMIGRSRKQRVYHLSVMRKRFNVPQPEILTRALKEEGYKTKEELRTEQKRVKPKSWGI